MYQSMQQTKKQNDEAKKQKNTSKKHTDRQTKEPPHVIATYASRFYINTIFSDIPFIMSCGLTALKNNVVWDGWRSVSYMWDGLDKIGNLWVNLDVKKKTIEFFLWSWPKMFGGVENLSGDAP